jgi:uncharacterized protein (TIGR02594 family)
MMEITALSLAMRYIGVAERPGSPDHPLIRWWLELCGLEGSPDEVPWCSAFVNGVAWELGLPRSKSARARSWLDVGLPVPLALATAGWDVVVLRRGDDPAAGHVGFFVDYCGSTVWLLGGNQGNRVTIQAFPVDRVLGARRLLIQ